MSIILFGVIYLEKIKKYSIIGAVFTLIAGSLLHFVYEWSGSNEIVSVFGAVNESTWEHLKLLFWPIVFFGIIEYFVYGKSMRNFIPVKVMSILLGMLTITALFYTYTGILGENYLVLDILTFVVGVIVAYVFAYRNLKSQDKYTSKTAQTLGWLGLIALIAAFVIFTFYPPDIGLFEEPTEE